MWKPQEHCEWGAEGWELACKVSRAQQAEQKSLPQRGEEEQRSHPVPWAWGLWFYSCLGGELHQTINREGIESGVSLRKELVCRSAWEEAKGVKREAGRLRKERQQGWPWIWKPRWAVVWSSMLDCFCSGCCSMMTSCGTGPEDEGREQASPRVSIEQTECCCWDGDRRNVVWDIRSWALDN